MESRLRLSPGASIAFCQTGIFDVAQTFLSRVPTLW